MPAPRREFRVGEVIGHGLTVTHTERVTMRTTTGITYLGIQVRCSCGQPFVVAITNLATIKGCGCRRRNSGRYRSMKAMWSEFDHALRTDFRYVEAIAKAAHRYDAA